MSSRIGHLYWGLGPNFGMMGNVRLGFGRVEIGVLQGTGFGLACINTMNRIFKLAIWAFILSLSLGFRVFTGEW